MAGLDFTEYMGFGAMDIGYDDFLKNLAKKHSKT